MIDFTPVFFYTVTVQLIVNITNVPDEFLERDYRIVVRFRQTCILFTYT